MNNKVQQYKLCSVGAIVERRWACKHWQAPGPVVMQNAKFPGTKFKHVLRYPGKEGLTSTHLPTFPYAGLANGIYKCCETNTKGKIITEGNVYI